ncbi:hypothetical protein Q4R52_20945, partial [Morganella morganii]
SAVATGITIRAFTPVFPADSATPCAWFPADAVTTPRRTAEEARGEKAWSPQNRERQVSFALRAYALLATSADKGAVRDK